MILSLAINCIWTLFSVGMLWYHVRVYRVLIIGKKNSSTKYNIIRACSRSLFERTGTGGGISCPSEWYVLQVSRVPGTAAPAAPVTSSLAWSRLKSYSTKVYESESASVSPGVPFTWSSQLWTGLMDSRSKPPLLITPTIHPATLHSIFMHASYTRVCLHTNFVLGRIIGSLIMYPSPLGIYLPGD